ncbi:MAG: eCIS core domain-containing protein [Tumebacillaceae bacterium]
MKSHQLARSHKAAEASEQKQQAKQAESTPAQLQSMLAVQSGAMTPGHIMQLQKTLGNRAVSQLMSARVQSAQVAQLKGGGPEEEEPLQMKMDPVQKKENKTGMPDQLKSGLESTSGMDLSDVRVHYNSEKPAQLSALAYAQGNDIHIGPGQEQHLPHEGWHVVQQRQGRVQPTVQAQNGAFVNDDAGLEKEADVMGSKAMQMKLDDEEKK